MDDCLTALHFAEDLMKYAFGTQMIPWEKPDVKFYTRESPFNDDIGDAVMSIINHNYGDISGCHNDLTEMGARTASLFSRLAFEAAPAYFPKGYSPERMLCYCAMLVGVALSMYGYPSNGIPECTSDVIGTVLTSHILTGEFKKQGGYQRLSDISGILLRHLCEKMLTKQS